MRFRLIILIIFCILLCTDCGKKNKKKNKAASRLKTISNKMISYVMPSEGEVESNDEPNDDEAGPSDDEAGPNDDEAGPDDERNDSEPEPNDNITVDDNKIAKNTSDCSLTAGCHKG